MTATVTDTLCRNCRSAPPRWESRVQHGHEVWLGTCPECGHMTAFNSTSGRQFDEPLGSYLGDGRDLRPSSPAWVRVYVLSQQPPWNLVWRHRPAECQQCRAAVVFESSRWARLDFESAWSLCLACGHVVLRYLNPSWGLHDQVDGQRWTPPCPAVKKLRRAVFMQPLRPVLTFRVGEDE